MTAWGAYREIASALRQRVVDGTYRAGMLLPGENELSREYGVARNTVRRALDVLESEGLIMVITGVGRFVHPAPSHAARPMYERIAADLRARIESGAFPAGTVLPSEAQICERYGVARFTARRAFEELAAAGLVDCVRGKGRYVRRDVPR